MSGRTTVVVGAGVGGLSAAVRLAARDPSCRVVVLEAAESVGGKVGQWRSQGFRWDTGPSVLTMRPVLEELFAAAGQRLEDHLTLLPVDPLTRYQWPDGTVLPLERDWPALATRLEALRAGSSEEWLGFLRYAARLYRLTWPTFVVGQRPSLRGLHRLPLTDALRIDPLRTMDAAIRAQVSDPRLRQLLGRFATYVGGSPFRAPATLNVIAHVELTGGVWYPRGGLRAVPLSLLAVARELGVQVRTGAPVQRVLFAHEGRGRWGRKRPRTEGVELADGQRIAADNVILNVDLATACDGLLSELPAARRLGRRLQRAEPSLSGFVLLLGVEDDQPQLAHHNIFFSADYRAEFDAIAAGRLPEDPTIYVAITSRTEPEDAPVGCANWFVLVNAAPEPLEGPDHRCWDAFRDRILERLAAHGVDVRGQIRVERRMTPADLRAASGAWRGGLYGPSPNSRLAAFRRAPNRFPGVDGLYLCGGTTHPGGGVPMVMLSGRQAVRQLWQDEG